jgi:RNA polymerase sigma factor (sigma-70 family)
MVYHRSNGIQYFSFFFVYHSDMEMALKNEIGIAFEQEKHRLLGFIRGKVKTLEEAEDILQDVFFQTLDGISVTSRIDNLIGWLYAVARNRIIDHYRKKRPETTSVNHEDEFSLNRILDDSGLHPESLFYRNLVMEAVTECIEDLPEEQREVFVMQEIEGMTFREIAEMTGESINTLISRKRYAVAFMRKQLKEIQPMLDELK